MTSFKLAAIFAAIYVASNVSTANLHTVKKLLHQLEEPKRNIPGRFQTSTDELARSLQALTRQSLMQQFYVNQRIRSEGQSGLKQVRVNSGGTKSYYSNNGIGGFSVAAMHNHANNRRTLGMGEFVAVLNGVEFRTRHNDYKMNTPSKTSSKYRAVEDITYPPVPPSVLAKPTVPEQVAEMREYFKAWITQDSSLRDYKPYFKPVLSYMEGAWTKSTHSIQESFASDRHNLAADTWDELFDLERFNAYSGNKDLKENFAFLPTAIFDIVNGTFPLLAQWNYRILCHELKDDLPLDRLRPVEDLASRMRFRRTMQSHVDSRSARFQLNSFDRSKFVDVRTGTGELLDKLMYEIPGMDNYGATLRDDAYGLHSVSIVDNERLNAAYYHRILLTESSEVSGQRKGYRGFSDSNMFVAMTTQDDVVGMTLHDCYEKDECDSYPQKYSYAIPMEIIYMTPLTNWNPYNLAFHGHENWRATDGSRRNGLTPDKALDGISYKNFFQTPSEFFSEDDNLDSANPSGADMYVLDRSNIPRKVRASGHRIHIDIEGVGLVRQRFPIMPVHDEGGPVMKQLQALTDYVLAPEAYPFVRSTGAEVVPETAVLTFRTSPSSAETGAHTHTVEVDAMQLSRLEGGRMTEWIETSHDNGHSHAVQLRGFVTAEGELTDIWIQWCGKLRRECADGHSKDLTPVDPSTA